MTRYRCDIGRKGIEFTPDAEGVWVRYSDADEEVRRLRLAIITALNSPAMMGAEDIEVLAAALGEQP